MISHSFRFYGIAFFVIILLRYFLIAGSIYYLLYYSFPCPMEKSFSKNNPSWTAIRHDIKLSVLSAGVFALAAAFIMCGYSCGLTRLYSNTPISGLWYIVFSYGVVLILQDTYFYFTHRWFHHPTLFAWLHQGHHKSRHPTPWTSFAFDPLEAIVQSIFLIFVVFIIPLHFITLIAVLSTMTVWALLNHLSIERLPISFPHHWLGKWFIGPAHHSVHHLKYTYHYGLYFTFWDCLLGTQDSNYIKHFQNES